MKLGNLLIPATAALAPMAGVADRAFREICMEQGACYCVGEMASAKGMRYHNSKTAELLQIGEAERPCAVQLFGDEPSAMAEAAAEAVRFSPDAVDINMGCPAPKVAGHGSGSALMRNPVLAGEIIKAVRGATSLPVTVKIRAGWDDSSRNAVEIAQIAESCGADAVTVHGRTRQQMYAKPVDYDIIAAVKRAVDIPVIGNGDVCGIESAGRMYETGCDLIMVGRGARGAPWLFRILDAWFRRGIRLPEPDPEERMSLLKRQVTLACEYKGEAAAMREARKHAAWYVGGWHGAAALRRMAGTLSHYEDMEAFIKEALSVCSAKGDSH